MAITREEAYRVLELHRDATGEEIRASYKRLALRWHPDKHNNSQEATKKFQEVSSAYKRLTSTESDDEIHLTRADMFDIFTHVFFHRNVCQVSRRSQMQWTISTWAYLFSHFRPHVIPLGMFDFNRYNPYESDEDYSDEDEDDMEDELLHGIATRLRNKYDRSKTTNYSKTNGKPAHNLSEAEALKNAEELIKEEERDRKKAEKRRQKKKRNKERKKQKEKEKKDQNDEKENKKENDREKTNIQFEKLNLKETQNMNNKPPQNVKTSKLNQSPTSGVKEKSQNISSSNKKEQQNLKGNKSRNQVNGETDSDEDEPDWDQSSAFFARAAGRNPPSNPSNSAPSTLKDTSKTNTTSSSNTADTQSNKNNNEKEPVTEQLDPVVLQSRQLAVRGNEMANLGNYAAAIDLFTQAIKLDARDFRFFGNRSYCYDRLGQYEKALQDADVAISLAPDWPKGYFRRGRALAGIKLFSDSEVAFAQVLKLDKYCEDAMFELARVRVQQLEDMGFPTTQSEAAIRSYGTVQAALEALLAGKVHCPSTEEIYQSDDEEEKIRVAQHIAPVEQNISGCKSVWVGNVNAEIVSELELQQIFSQCGKIESVKVLPTRYCAFINYSTPEAAARAISILQGFQLGGQNLLLRYPNNSGISAVLQPQVNESLAKTKLTGPVNGDECYFWRTTGCSFGDRCRNRHLPENKGIDLKKVEAKYGGRI